MICLPHVGEADGMEAAHPVCADQSNFYLFHGESPSVYILSD